ncbi:MAG: hypothetical protein SGI77_09060 [Pirellulaceae bacterium]|nr:hypothetical protein [Pirellulaceae bacterium]
MESIRDKDPPRPSDRLSESRDAITGISLQRRIEPKKLQQLLRGDLDWIVMKSLEKDRRRRYESANGLAEDVRRFLNDQPIAARPPSRAYQFNRFVRKNRGLVASLATIFTVLVLGILGTTLFAWRAGYAEKQAIHDRDSAKASQQTAQRERETAEQERTKAIEQERAANDAKSLADAARESTEAILAKSNLMVADARLKEHRINEAKQVLHSIPEKYRKLNWSMANREIDGSDITFYGHTSIVTAVQYSQDGKRIVSSSWDGTIKVWDAVTGKELLSIPFHPGSFVFDAKLFSGDGKIAACGETGLIKIFDSQTGMELSSFQTEGRNVDSIAISPDSQRIAAEVDTSIQIWNFASIAVEN